MPIKGHGALQLLAAGEDTDRFYLRDVYYLIRGRKRTAGTVKVCLVHGSFFETIPIDQLIRGAFIQALTEALNQPPDDDLIAQLTLLFSKQQFFSRTRSVANASVKLRFRIMTEAKREGNVFDPQQYPDIHDNTLSFIVPYHEKARALHALRDLIASNTSPPLTQLTLVHRLNGPFFALQLPFIQPTPT